MSNRRRKSVPAAFAVAIAILCVMLRGELGELFSGGDTASPSSASRSDSSSAPIEPTPQSAGERATDTSAESGDVLRPTGMDTYESAAGLIYGRGSQEGNRRAHILRHTKDDTTRPVHGVFDDAAMVFALIDEAWGKSEQGGADVQKAVERGRTVITVDLDRRIGFEGGQKGQRSGHHPLTHVRLVLEGRKVITAYPVRGP